MSSDIEKENTSFHRHRTEKDETTLVESRSSDSELCVFDIRSALSLI